MVILHIGNLRDNKANGVMVVVPQHLRAQAKFNEVALLNVNNYNPKENSDSYKLFYYKDFEKWDINKMPKPFNKPDIVVIHEIYIIEYIKIYKNLIKNNIPYIIMAHGSLNKIAQNYKPLKKKIGNLLFFNGYLKNAYAIQFLSQMEKNNSIFNEKKNNYIMGNGIEIANVVDKSFSKEGLKIVAIGRYDIVAKAYDILIEACNKIKDEMRENKITIEVYGKNNYNRKKKLDEIVEEYGIKDIVKLHEGIYDEDKIKKLCESDIFIQTSRYEGQSVGLMEAMQMKLPVIVTPAAEIGDVNNKMGIVCGCNPDDVAKAILKANESKDKFIEWSNNARNYIVSNYSWDIIAKKTVEQYEKIIEKKKNI